MALNWPLLLQDNPDGYCGCFSQLSSQFRRTQICEGILNSGIIDYTKQQVTVLLPMEGKARTSFYGNYWWEMGSNLKWT